MSNVLYIRTHKDADLHEKLARWVKEDPSAPSVNQLAIKILRQAVDQKFPKAADPQLSFSFDDDRK